MIRFRELIRSERGAAATEFALVAPTFLMFLFLMLDGGRMLFQKQALNELAVAGARCAALKPTGCTTIAEVQSWTAARGTARSMLKLTAGMVTVAQSTTCNGLGGMAQVTVAMPFPRGAMALLPQSVSPATLTSSACFPVAS